MSGNDYLVDIENLKFKYTSSEELVLKEIDFKVNKGEFVGIIGPSGAGKTTLCSIIKGLIPHTINGKIKGKVDVIGKDMKVTPPAKNAAKVGMVMQDPEGQIIGLTVKEDLAFGPENLEWDPDRILERIPEVLDMVRLSGREERESFSLSGGQKQRLAIADALMMDPELLILDEPTSELDPLGREEVFDTIKRLKEEKDITVIVVEQTVENLVNVCDRIIVLNEGEIIADNNTRDLFKQQVELMEDISGKVSLPQILEVTDKLAKEGYISKEMITPFEKKGIENLKSVLKEGGSYNEQ